MFIAFSVAADGCGFAQIYVCSSLDFALATNSKRSIERRYACMNLSCARGLVTCWYSRVTDAVIHRMVRRLEPPDVRDRVWESHSVTVQSSLDGAEERLLKNHVVFSLCCETSVLTGAFDAQ